MKNCLTIFTIIFLFLSGVTSLSAQNKNSVQGDFEALHALYNSTQGENLPRLSSESQLPPPEEAQYPFMYIINGNIYWVKINKEQQMVEWRNAGAPWKDKTGWENMTPETMGEAVGVTTDGNGRVIEIDLQKVTTREGSSEGILTDGNNLAGELPPDLGNLKRLKKFNVKQNFLYGQLPPEIGLMRDLERLSLAGHHWEVDMSHKRLWLEAEHVHYNRNGGEDPYSFSVSGKDVTETNRFKTELPPEIGDISGLKLIELNWQFIQGKLPSNWGNLTNLEGLLIEQGFQGGENPLYSEIPSQWGNLTSMVYFKMGSYQLPARLFGSLPQGMLRWDNLVNLSLHSNDLSGEFPVFENVSELFYFNVSRNEFTGEFPWTSIFNGKNSGLNKFSINNNNFIGSLPESIPDAVFPKERPEGKYSIASFSVQYNQFEGNVPEWTTTMRGQMTYNISHNNFSGGFPPGLETNNKLKTLRIHENNFSGPLPDVEWSTRQMNWFQIRGNNFEGEIPESWKTLFQDENGDWRSGKVFQFQDNCLSGRIPDWGRHVDINAYVFNNNCYSFKDIGPVYDELTSANIGFEAGNQKPFGSAMERTMPENDLLILDLSGYHYKGNQYQWFKDGDPVPGGDSSILEISSVTRADEGVYHLEVTSSSMPELGTQVSEPITFTLGEDDGLNDGNNSDDGSDNNDNGGSDDKSGDDTGNGGEGNSTAAFPSAPVLYGPDQQAENTGLTPNFEWSAVENADYYILHVSRHNPSGMTLDIEVVETTYTPAEIFDDGTVHDWRVRAVKDGKKGNWSDIRRFTTNEGNLPDIAEQVSPSHYSKNTNPLTELVWEEVGADSYEIRLMKKKTSEILLSDAVSDTSYVPTEALPDTTDFVWQVKSITGGVHGAWGPRWEFSTGTYENSSDGDRSSDGGTDTGAGFADSHFPSAPVLFGPEDNRENISLTPQFAWSDIGADYYILHASRLNPTGMFLEEIVHDTTFTPDEIFDDGTVHDWRVRGVKEGEKGEWSDIRRFKTGEEDLPDVAGTGSPGHFTQNVDQATELVWEDAGADTYEIRLLNKKTSELLFSDSVSDTSYVPNEALPDTTDFVWQVKSISGGVHGAWGPRWEFSTGVYGIEPPALISPEQGGVFASGAPAFEWEDMGADRYVIKITRDTTTKSNGQKSATTTSATVILEETTQTMYTPEISLEPYTQYYWQVQAIKDGKKSEWSDRGKFTLSRAMAQKASAAQSTDQQPVETSLDQNYPNPFNPTTRIEFALSEAQKVSIKVYDMAGRQVAKLVDDVLQAGHHSATFDASQLASGIYIYRFISNSHQFSRKMTLIK